MKSMFRHVILFVVALAIALSTYACLDVFVGIPCDYNTYPTQQFAGEDEEYCYYLREGQDRDDGTRGLWVTEAVHK